MVDAQGTPRRPVIHIHGGPPGFDALCGLGRNVAVTSAMLADTFGVECVPCRTEAARLGLLGSIGGGED